KSPNSDAACRIRERVRTLGDPRQKFQNPAERAVLRARDVVGGDAIDKIYRNKEIGAYLAPFLGAEKAGTASYHDPLTIGDDDALFWLGYLRDHRVVVDQRMLDFVSELFAARRRTLWIPAAEALVSMALHDTTAKQQFLDLCRDFGSPAPAVDSERARHLHRHIRYAAAYWLGYGGAPLDLPDRLRTV